MHPANDLPNLMPARRIRWVARGARMLLWLVVAFWLLIGVSWGVLHGWIVPRISDFRPQLEAAASKATGMPVRIGQLRARSQGLIPSFELVEVSLLDTQGQAALRLPSVLLSLSPRSLWSLGFEQLVLDRPELAIRRAADGRIFVAGIDLALDRSDARDADAFADWFFSQSELAVRNGTVRWTDELRGAPPLALTEVNWVLRNPGKRHLMRLDATPPAAWGERWSLLATLREPLLSTRSGDWRDWTGQLYGEFSRVDVSQLRPYANLASLGVDLSSGRGALRAWADVAGGQITGGVADVALQDVVARFGPELEPLALANVAGRFGGAQSYKRVEFRTEGLAFATQDGVVWPGGNVAVVHNAAEGRRPPSTELKADQLDLAALALIAERLPMADDTRTLVGELAPRGRVELLDAQWQGALSAPITLAARGRVSGLEITEGRAPADAAPGTPGRPGVSGAAVQFNLTHEGGQADVALAGGSLSFPGVFEHPRIAMDQLSTQVRWTWSGPSLALQLAGLRFANADTEGQAEVSWRMGPVAASAAPGTSDTRNAPDTRLPGVLELTGSLSRGNGAQVHRYLPLVLNETTRHYVRDAVKEAALSDVRFMVKGALQNLPFRRPQDGEFLVRAKIEKGVYAYVPASAEPGKPWPALRDLSGELVFERQRMALTDVQARLAGLDGLQLAQGNATIADLAAARVNVELQAKGPLTEALTFVNNSPLSAITDNVLAGATGSGSADYAVKLMLPLEDLGATRVQGSVTLAGNDVRLAPGAPELGRLRGAVSFTESGFKVAGAQARLLGGELRFEGGTQPPVGGVVSRDVLFRGQGNFTAEGLRQMVAPASGNPAVSSGPLAQVTQLARQVSGGASYAASFGFKRGQPEFSLSSNLQGLAIDLPAPLNKPADTVLALKLDHALVPASLAAGRAMQDQTVLALGRLVAAQYVRELGTGPARVLRGSIGVGLATDESAQDLPDQVAINVNLPELDVDAWRSALGPLTNSNPNPSPSLDAVTAEARTSADDMYVPTVFALRTKLLKVDGRQLNNVVLGGSREGRAWRANIDAEELNGYAEYRMGGAAGSGRLFARLARLRLVASTATEVEALLDEQPANVPALDIVVDDLELRGKKFGRIEIDAVNRGTQAVARDGGVREWRLNKFNLTVPEAVLTASGNWAAIGAQGPTGPRRAQATPSQQRRTLINFKLDIADSGELLKRFGMEGVIRRGRGRLEGQAGWIGSPLSLDYPSLNGQINVNVASGQFLKADPGIAKLFGVLSLQSLPRRLSLDFRDVFSEGFAFDFVRGDVSITNGQAYTNNLQMKGVNAAVLMEGTADIARETQDLRVVVVPEINAGTASLIATAINPAIGLGTFLAQMFLSKPLAEANTQEFHIDSTWSEPRVTRVPRGSLRPAAPPSASLPSAPPGTPPLAAPTGPAGTTP
jgi:uncharacterized protein (TIGR02099 family)